jgi:hypothetical protein
MRLPRAGVTVRDVSSAAVTAVAALVLVGTTGCTSQGPPTPGPTVEQPSFTSIPQARTVDRLEPPVESASDVARLLVRDADGIFWNGSGEPGRAAPVRAGQAYRLTGRCLPATAGGTLVVDVLGPPAEGAVEGAPSVAVPGDAVATITVPCDGTETRQDLRDLPAGSGPLSVAERTSQVATGWVVLTRAS